MRKYTLPGRTYKATLRNELTRIVSSDGEACVCVCVYVAVAERREKMKNTSTRDSSVHSDNEKRPATMARRERESGDPRLWRHTYNTHSHKYRRTERKRESAARHSKKSLRTSACIPMFLTHNVYIPISSGPGCVTSDDDDDNNDGRLRALRSYAFTYIVVYITLCTQAHTVGRAPPQT